MVPLVDTVRAAGGAPWVQEKPEKLEPWAEGADSGEAGGQTRYWVRVGSRLGLEFKILEHIQLL